jgi:signal transduction histidine kinase
VADGAGQGRPGAQRWVFSTTAAFLMAAAVLRSVLEFEGAQLGLVIVLLAAWSLLTASEPALSRRLSWYFPVYIALQAAVVFVLLGQSDGSDFFGILLAVPSMLAMQRWRVGAALALIGLFAALVVVGVLEEYGPADALALAAVYTAVSLFLGSYALTDRRASEARVRNEALAADLREANQRLAESAAQAERLAGARERQRLARDLHDSVTQTLFSMTLAAHSATLMLARRPQGLDDQLDQIEQLWTSARAELEALSAALPTSRVAEGDLAAGLRRHLDERAARDGLQVTLTTDGDRRLPPAAEEAVLRIVQEALNNVVKHADVAQAEVRLRLRRPARVEIEDHGRGFAPEAAGEAQAVSTCEARADSAGRPGAGLGIMAERATEVGWRLAVTSSPGGGTLVVAQEIDGDADAARGDANGEVDEGGGDRD